MIKSTTINYSNIEHILTDDQGRHPQRKIMDTNFGSWYSGYKMYGLHKK